MIFERLNKVSDKITSFRYMVPEQQTIKGFKMYGSKSTYWTGIQVQLDNGEESAVLGSSQHPVVREVKIPRDLHTINCEEGDYVYQI